MGKLIGPKSNLQVIPIIGMAGIGKTTLAKSAYDHQSMLERFDIRGWITVSQEYNVQDLLLGLLRDTGYSIEREYENYHQLGQYLHRHLWGRMYLIIMDDMWSIEAWDKLKLFLPDNNNGSRVIITTRLSNVANNFDYSNVYEMKLLDENASWSLLSKMLFVQEGCPPELEEVGKMIAKNCKGLPLSIAVIGGLLANSKMTREYLEYVVEDVSTTVNSNDDEHCLKILSLSYNNLPVHLKPCFLYFGVFPEDHEIRVSELIKLWAAEGFLKPHNAKTMEEVAKDYLQDLIAKNLIFVSKFGSTGTMQNCKIHDLLRDLCLREAKREKFICVTGVSRLDLSQNIHRRIAICRTMSHDEALLHIPRALQSTSSTTRSLTCHSKCDSPPSLKSRLLRVLNVVDDYSEDILYLVNSRYLNGFSHFPSSMYKFWNLQTIVLDGEFDAPPEIWEMAQLRHLMILRLSLPDPPTSALVDQKNDKVVLENLQTIRFVQDFKCSEEVLNKIPNIKILKIFYTEGCGKDFSYYFLINLCHLHKLESLLCAFPLQHWTQSDFLRNIQLPHSLKKLTLYFCSSSWEDVATKIGSLPNLEKLKLARCFRGEEWKPVEGQFRRLKLLLMENCHNLIYWEADKTHFPCLEYLIFSQMFGLKEIPSSIGDILTLRSIQLTECPDSVIESAKQIIEDQKCNGNEDIRLQVDGCYKGNDQEEYV